MHYSGPHSTNSHYMLIDILGLIGVIACAVTGALQAGRVRMDYFGVIIISFVTALGGGTIRDLMLNNYPLAWIKDPLLLYTTISCSLLTILLARYMKYLKSIFLILDAIGLVSFALGATLIALDLGHGMTMACVAAVATGAFGGVIRDILCNRIPLAFQHELYASIAIVIAMVYVGLVKIGVNTEVAIVLTTTLGLTIRLLAIKFKLSLRVFDYDEDKYTNVAWLEKLPHPNLRKIIFIRRQNKLVQHDAKLPSDTFASRSHTFQELDVAPIEHLDGNRVVAKEEAIIVTAHTPTSQSQDQTVTPLATATTPATVATQEKPATPATLTTSAFSQVGKEIEATPQSQINPTINTSSASSDGSALVANNITTSPTTLATASEITSASQLSTTTTAVKQPHQDATSSSNRKPQTIFIVNGQPVDLWSDVTTSQHNSNSNNSTTILGTEVNDNTVDVNNNQEQQISQLFEQHPEYGIVFPSDLAIGGSNQETTAGVTPQTNSPTTSQTTSGTDTTATSLQRAITTSSSTTTVASSNRTTIAASQSITAVQSTTAPATPKTTAHQDRQLFSDNLVVMAVPAEVASPTPSLPTVNQACSIAVSNADNLATTTTTVDLTPPTNNNTFTDPSYSNTAYSAAASLIHTIMVDEELLTSNKPVHNTATPQVTPIIVAGSSYNEVGEEAETGSEAIIIPTAQQLEEANDKLS